MRNVSNIVCNIFRECQDDYVGLWSIAWEFRHIDYSDPQEVRELTMEVVSHLIDSREIAVGQFLGTQFVKWEEPKEALVARIVSEWVALGRDPDLGEIAWFTADRNCRTSRSEGVEHL